MRQAYDYWQDQPGIYLSRTACKPKLTTGPCARSRRSGKVCISKREKVQQLHVEAAFHQPTIGTSSTPSHTTGNRSWPLSTMPFRHSSLSHAQPFGDYLGTRALAHFLGAPAEQASAWPPRCWRPKVPAPDLATDTSITPKSALRVSVQASHQSPTGCTNQRLTPYHHNRKRCGSESHLPAVCGPPTRWRSTTLPWRRVSLINY